jgi:Holliday junction resolvasome RuvABC endonuclease subunit
VTKPKAYLGLDPSLTGFGVALYCPETGEHDLWLLTSKKKGVDRLLSLCYELESITHFVQKSYDLADVAMEDTVRLSYAASALGELAGVVKATLHVAVRGDGRYPLRVPPASLKKFATGKGNAKKVDIILSVYKKYGLEVTNDNLADAYVLARIASRYVITQYEADIVNKLFGDEKFRDGEFSLSD